MRKKFLALLLILVLGCAVILSACAKNKATNGDLEVALSDANLKEIAVNITAITTSTQSYDGASGGTQTATFKANEKGYQRSNSVKVGEFELDEDHFYEYASADDPKDFNYSKNDSDEWIKKYSTIKYGTRMKAQAGLEAFSTITSYKLTADDFNKEGEYYVLKAEKLLEIINAGHDDDRRTLQPGEAFKIKLAGNKIVEIVRITIQTVSDGTTTMTWVKTDTTVITYGDTVINFPNARFVTDGEDDIDIDEE